MIFFINFRNNYTMFGVTYAIPLITDRDYGEISRERACAIQESHLMHLLSVVSVFICAPGYLLLLYGCTGTGYGQLENSYIYLALTLTSLASTSVIGWASKRWSDRNLLCCFQIISWSGLITYTLSSGLGQFAHDGCTLYAACSQPQSRLDLGTVMDKRMTSFWSEQAQRRCQWGGL